MSAINPIGWVQTAAQTNAVATATQPAPATPVVAMSPKKNVVFGVDASFSSAPASPVLLQIKDGSTVIWQDYITSTFTRQFIRGINVTPGNAVSAVLAAAGSTIIGTVNIDGCVL